MQKAVHYFGTRGFASFPRLIFISQIITAWINDLSACKRSWLLLQCINLSQNKEFLLLSVALTKAFLFEVLNIKYMDMTTFLPKGEELDSEIIDL